MEAMIKYYEGETLGLGGKTAGSPGARLRAHAPASLSTTLDAGLRMMDNTWTLSRRPPAAGACDPDMARATEPTCRWRVCTELNFVSYICSYEAGMMSCDG